MHASLHILTGFTSMCVRVRVANTWKHGVYWFARCAVVTHGPKKKKCKTIVQSSGKFPMLLAKLMSTTAAKASAVIPCGYLLGGYYSSVSVGIKLYQL